MTLKELCRVLRPAQKIRIKKSMSDAGILCLRYEILDQSGLVDPVVDPSFLDREVVVMHSDSMNENTILIRVR